MRDRNMARRRPRSPSATPYASATARTLGALAAALLIAVFLAACRDKDDRSSLDSPAGLHGQGREVAAVIGDYEQAFHRGDAMRLCRELLLRGTSPLECRRAMRQLAGQPFYRHVQIDVRRVNVHGARATARVLLRSGNHRESTTYSLVKRGGRWRIDALEPQNKASR
jgi:hypothetical protein